MAPTGRAAGDACEALVRADDHDTWLAALFAPADRRAALHALAAFALEVGRVRARVRQPLAGEIRLQWWRDAIEAPAGDAGGGHPVAGALFEAVERHDLSRGALIDVIEALRQDLYDDPIVDVEALETFFDATRGAMIRLASRVLGGPAVEVAKPARHAGIARGIAGMLADLPRVVEGSGRVLIPGDILARHGTDFAQLRAGLPEPVARAVLADLRGVARSHLAALRGLEPAIAETVAPAFLTTNLAEPLLRASERHGIDPFRTAMDLPPWKRHWILWRAARRGGVL